MAPVENRGVLCKFCPEDGAFCALLERLRGGTFGWKPFERSVSGECIREALHSLRGFKEVDMARRVDSKGDALNGRRSSWSSGGDGANMDVQVDNGLLAEVTDNYRTLFDTIRFFAEHDGGYLKVRRAADGADLHLTYTWSLGPEAGRYVYARVEFWRFTFGLELLQTKVLEVERGQRRATPDKRVG